MGQTHNRVRELQIKLNQTTQELPAHKYHAGIPMSLFQMIHELAGWKVAHV